MHRHEEVPQHPILPWFAQEDWLERRAGSCDHSWHSVAIQGRELAGAAETSGLLYCRDTGLYRTRGNSQRQFRYMILMIIMWRWLLIMMVLSRSSAPRAMVSSATGGAWALSSMRWCMATHPSLPRTQWPPTPTSATGNTTLSSRQKLQSPSRLSRQSEGWSLYCTIKTKCIFF